MSKNSVHQDYSSLFFRFMQLNITESKDPYVILVGQAYVDKRIHVVSVYHTAWQFIAFEMEEFIVHCFHSLFNVVFNVFSSIHILYEVRAI